MATSKKDSIESPATKKPYDLFLKIDDNTTAMEIEGVGCIVKNGEALVFVPMAVINKTSEGNALASKRNKI
jgi:hypothetical protein